MPNCGVIVIPMSNSTYGFYIYSMDNLAKGVYIDITNYDKLEKFRQVFSFGEENAPIEHVFTTHGAKCQEVNMIIRKTFPDAKIYGGVEGG